MVRKYIIRDSVKQEELQFFEKYLACLVYSHSFVINNLTMNIAICLDENVSFLTDENIGLLDISMKEMEGVLKN